MVSIDKSTATPALNWRRKDTVVALGVTNNPWINEEARKRGWRLFNLNFCGGEVPDGLEFDGAILIRYSEDPWVRVMQQRRDLPIVYLGTAEATTDLLQPSVTPNMFSEGQLAADHFAERSFRQVGYFGPDPWSDGKRLWEGFHSRSAALGIETSLFRTRRVPAETNESRGPRRRREFTDWIRALPKPVGILAPGDGIAALYCTWAALAGFDVPGEVAVLARGNRPEISEAFIPSISHLEIDGKRQIQAACELLERMMAGDKVSEEAVLIEPKGVVVRESTDILATPDKEIASVLRYMWDNLDLELTVEDAARDFNISSRQLARKFRKALGRTFRQELRRKRLEEAQQLLRNTGEKLDVIAKMVGFQSTSYLHRAFKGAFGVTPAAYRKSR